jgi:hypothetical protein
MRWPAPKLDWGAAETRITRKQGLTSTGEKKWRVEKWWCVDDPGRMLEYCAPDATCLRMLADECEFEVTFEVHARDALNAEELAASWVADFQLATLQLPLAIARFHRSLRATVTKAVDEYIFRGENELLGRAS